MKLAGVRFRDNWKIYDFDAGDVEISVGDEVIVDSDRGLGFARVVRVREGELPEPAERKEAKKAPPPQEEEEIEIDIDDALAGVSMPEKKEARGVRRVLRKATDEDLQKERKNRGREADAFGVCQDLIADREMPMKLIRAEYSFDASRITFFFFSENRVDFRELVKELAHRLHARIEMRQVGVRDVARIIGGFGSCGRELCCASFLRNFEPVSIRMAKKQEMVLNPAKISGVCGRLLCCLSYEYQVYDEVKKDVAEMKEAVLREKRAEEERRQDELRRAAEEERRALQDRQRQDEDQRRQDQRQRDRDRSRQQEQSRDGRKQPHEKPQEQRQKQKQHDKAQPQQKPPPQDQQAPAAEQQPDKTAKSKRKRRFWRKKKKKPGSGGGQQPGPGGPAAGS